MLVVMMALTSSAGLAEEPKFCWRDTTTRGVGTIPVDCAPGLEKIAALCYTPCPTGYARASGTVDCHAVCPEGMRDDGLYCRDAEYGRGAGYPWQFGDGLNLDGARDRCARDSANPQGCEQWGAVIYPKCKTGYENFGCCICRPVPTPVCGQGKWKDLNPDAKVDLSCGKKIIVGNPSTADCPPGQEKDAGLCYRNAPKASRG
jgi:hypothetical protein